MKAFSAEFEAELYRLFKARRDVRHFKRDAVPEARLMRLLEAGHMAPSVGLSQPWRFVLVESAAAKQAVADEFARCNKEALEGYHGEKRQNYGRLKLAGLTEAPVHLLVCVDEDPDQGSGLGRQTQPETLFASAVCAVQNMWLAARALGIGMGWVSILEPTRLLEPLDVPSEWKWVGYFCVGYPKTYEDSPELEREGWETRRPLSDVLFRR